MECQDQQPVETLESQIAQCFEESRDKNCTPQQPYRSPQVLLVGKAKRLIAGDVIGSVADTHGGYTYR